MSSYTHFTLNERKYLQELLFAGNSIRMIARSLGRSPSSISREISRNSSKKGYHHWRAQTLTIIRRRNKNTSAISEGSFEWNYVIEKLQLFWSPQQIAMRYRLEHSGSTLSTATIYRYIKRRYFQNVSKKNLRRRGKMWRPRSSNYNTIQPDRIIPEWPTEIKKRLRLGDWEGDTIYGAVGKGLIVTLVDRKSRFLVAGLLEKREAELTRKVLCGLLENLPVYSVSLDNGSEFSQFREMEVSLKTEVYFAEPHKPWQRGTNENTNDILRFFFPKGYDFHSLSPNVLCSVVDSINHRPRKCLGWLSPHEVFFGVALT